MLSGGVSEGLVYGLLLMVIVSVLVNLYFIGNKASRNLSKRKIDKETPNIIKRFTLEQSEKTRDAKRHKQRSHLDKRVIQLRQAYMLIEHKALQREIDSQEYWNLINSKLKKLIAIMCSNNTANPLAMLEEKIAKIREVISKNPESKSAIKAEESLERFYTACKTNASDPKRLAHYNQKLDDLYKRLSSANFRKLSEKTQIHKEHIKRDHKTLKRLKGSVTASEESVANLNKLSPDDFDFPIENLEKNNKGIRDSLNKYQHNVLRMQDGQEKAINHTIISTNDEQLSGANSELDDLSQEIQEENEKEISRLRGMVRDQKGLILELESSISNIEAAQGDKPIASDDIDNLKRCLKDAELCIDTLEAELESLHEKQEYHKNHPQEDPVKEKLSDNHLKALEATISQLEAEVIESKELYATYEVMMNSVGECLEAGSPEDISLTVYQGLSDMGWRAGLIVKAATRAMDVDPDGVMSSHEKTLINNMQVDEVDRKNNGQSINFRHMHIAGKIQLKVVEDTAPDYKPALSLLAAVDKVLHKMQGIQSNKNFAKKFDDSSNDIKKLAHEIDLTLDKMAKRSEESVRSSFGEMQDIARAKGLGASQIASFKNIEQQTISELQAEKTLRLTVKKQFLMVLKRLEER